MQGCPDTKGYFYETTKKNETTNHFKSWGWFENAKHCKMVFSSNNVNGKLKVKLLNVNDA